MFKASQQAVIQNANIQLVGIRYAEIKYFADFFNNFGTQCFLLAGFICGAVSQTPAFDAPCDYFWKVTYNISSAVCVALTTLGLLISVFISVFGQGLAIRGPPGSMVKAVEGMVIEQHNAVAIFVGGAISFVIQEIGMCFVMMDYWPAIVSSILLFLAGLYTYHISVRIYNRFRFMKEAQMDEWEDRDPAEELGDLNPDVFTSASASAGPSSKKNSTRASMNRNSMQSMQSNVSEQQAVKKEKSVLGKVVSKVKKTVAGGKKDEAMGTYEDDPYFDGGAVDDSATPYMDISDLPKSAKTATVVNPLNASAQEESSAKYSGYLTVKGKKSFSAFSDPWERKYFVVRGNFVHYYRDKRMFELDPQNPINRRPIDLEGYTLVAGAVEPPYAISLVPIDPDDIRKAWKFRCDTLNEFNNWVEILTDALSLCESEQSIVKVSDGKSEVLSRAGDMRNPVGGDGDD